MLRLAFACLLGLAGALPAAAACTGSNQIDALPAAVRAELRAAADAAPFAQGNLWQATRGALAITLVGTYHLDDPRHDATMARIGPVIDAATTVLVEAGPQEEAALKQALARDPSLVFITDGPTLPEMLPPETWARLKDALRARGIPPFLGAKMQPAYLGMMLGIPPCAAGAMTGAPQGLDQRIMDRAAQAGVPVASLEPYDTIFGIFAHMTPAQQTGMLTMSLAMEDQSEDTFATMLESYFAEDSRMIWELSRRQLVDAPGADPRAAAADFALMETSLVSARNRSWIPVLERAAQAGPVFAGFGALHLSGQDGVLALLERDGFTIQRLPF